MDKQKVLGTLLWDLQSFLLCLDSENLSFIAQAQKKSLSQLLGELTSGHTTTTTTTAATTVEDAEYMIMSCPSSSSPSNQLTDSPRTEDILSESHLNQVTVSPVQGPPLPLLPPLPPGGHAEDEEDDDDDEDTYEEAEPYVAETNTTNTERAESDSSHYESYGDDDDDDEDDDEGEGAGPVKDRAHYVQWGGSAPCLRPAPESRLCGYLWRRRWLGQWSKQLFFIRNHSLLCYKCAQDLLPQLELSLRGCRLSYKSKSSKKIQHQIKLVLVGSETLVLGYSSFQQADEWRRVMEELSAGGEEVVKTQSCLSLIRSDQLETSRSGPVHHDLQDLRPSGSSRDKDQPETRGVLSVLMNCQWQSLVCRVEEGLLNMYAEEEQEEEEQEEEQGGGVRRRRRRRRQPQYTVQLRGCDVRAGPDSGPAHRITLSMLGDQVAVLEVRSPEEEERWLKLLQDGAANHGRHDNNTQEQTGGALSWLKTPRFPTSNTYMDDLLQQHIYSNTPDLQNMVRSQDSVRCSSVSSRDSVTYSNTVFTPSSPRCLEVQRGVQKLELVGRRPVQQSPVQQSPVQQSPVQLRPVQLRAGSETNLTSAGKQNKRTFRQSLAVCTERAQVGFLNPLLRRTASAKNSLRRSPSALFIEHGKVFQRRKEWETKAAV